MCYNEKRGFNLLNLYLETGYNFNTATKFLQNLKRITCVCIKNGWLLKDPFASFSLIQQECDRPYLTLEEFNKFLEFNSPYERLNRECDFFFLSCYAGLAYIYVKKLKRLKIERS